MSRSDVRLVRGPGAEALVVDAKFAAAWADLARRCPWATGFQSPDYCAAWYRIYHERYEPVLIVARDDAEGRLDGLLPLAVSPRDGRVVAAGDAQAEYQAWLAEPSSGGAFIQRALAALWQAFPSVALRLSFLAPGTPIDWLGGSTLEGRALLRPHRRPFVALGDGSEIARSLAKRSNKNRVRQMGKVGEVRFEEVTDRAERHRLLAELIPFHDARHLVIRGRAPFSSDPLMAPFAAALLDVPGLLHVTALRCGDVLAAARMGMRNAHRNEVELGLTAYNPCLSKHSPGKFQILYLGQILQRQGIERIDLTAGGDAYKDRYANGEDTVHALTFFPSAPACWRGEARDATKRAVRHLLDRTGLTPNRVRATVGRLLPRPRNSAGSVEPYAGEEDRGDGEA